MVVVAIAVGAITVAVFVVVGVIVAVIISVDIIVVVVSVAVDAVVITAAWKTFFLDKCCCFFKTLSIFSFGSCF